MKRCAIILFVSPIVAGCATAGAGRPGPAAGGDAAQQAGVLGALQRETEDQARRIAELEARLALLEQESRRYRTEAPVRSTETVRIGEQRREPEDERAQRRPAPVAVVRLHERAPELEEPLALPEPPPGVAARLPVVPLPQERAGRALAERGAKASDESARERYRSGLRALRERRWDEARETFSAFLKTHPDHDLAANAMYWRGEALYAQRRYDEALIDFQSVISGFPRSEKAADALLKLGLCQRHVGDQAGAERSFRQLREKYPSSDAARIASRENPS